MAHKKNGFWNLCFSVVPGAGQMYQGFIKRGVSIMTMFFGWLAVCAFFGMDEFLFFAPVIWFFGFFDSLHRNSLMDAERERLKDEFLFIQRSEMEHLSLKKFRIPAAILLIFLGSYSLLQLVVDELIDAGFLFWDDEIVGMVYNRLPKMVFSFAIIFLGLYLIMGKKMEMTGSGRRQKEEYVPWIASYYEEEPVKAQFAEEEGTMQPAEGNHEEERGEGEEKAQPVGGEEENPEEGSIQPAEGRQEAGGEKI